MAFCPEAIFFLLVVCATNAGKKERVCIWAMSVSNLTLAITRTEIQHKRELLLPHPEGATRGHRTGIPSADRPAVKAY